jgi:hypothetical protein
MMEDSECVKTITRFGWGGGGGAVNSRLLTTPEADMVGRIRTIFDRKRI